VTTITDDAARPEPDSEGCLLIVGSYSDVASIVGPVAAKATAEIASSPALGDFIELRFVSIGPRPHPGAEPPAAVQCLAGELTRPGSGAERNYFALVIMDRSATVVEHLLSQCGADPVVAALPILYRGFASVEDRVQDAGPADQPGPAAEVVLATAGSWTQDDLADQLRRYAETLMWDFATWSEPGLTHDQLDQIRPGEPEPAAEERGPLDDDLEPGSLPAIPPGPDALTPAAELSAERADDAEGDPEPDRRLDAPPALELASPPAEAAARDAVAEPGPAGDAVPGRPRGRHAAPLPSAGPMHPPAPRDPSAAPPLAGPAGELLPMRPAAELPPGTSAAPKRRRIPALKWPSGRSAKGRRDGAPAGSYLSPRISGLVYLILTSEGVSSERASWRDGRSALLAVDEKLAAVPQIGFQIRVLQRAEDAVKGERQPAGQLSRRSMKHLADRTDLSALLTAARDAMKRDLAALQRGGTEIVKPAIVLFAVDAPLDDAITSEVYDGLTREASIMWVMPEAATKLISPAFTEREDTRKIPYHQAVADEIITILLGDRQEANK
jgi:hypothetical protein